MSKLNKLKSSLYLKTTVVLYLSLILISSSSVSALDFLGWGEKCKIPTLGGGYELTSSEECDGGKGLVCAGEACDCTYKTRYSYDHVSKECRRRVGKPCQYVEMGLEGQAALERLPFNLKCHSNADCVQFDLQSRAAGGVVDIEKISMCVCKPGYIASKDFDSCIIPPPQLEVANLPERPLKNKLDIKKVPFYTD